MHCQVCGYLLNVAAKFCPSCGSTVEPAAWSPGASFENNPDFPATVLPAPQVSAPLRPPQLVPSTSVPLQRMDGDSYYLHLNGQQSGPYTVGQVKTMWQSGTINASIQYWQTGMNGWQPLANIKHFLEVSAQSNANAPIIINNQVNQNVGAGYPMGVMLSPKSRGTFIILGFFLGCFGVHNFYAGYSGKGVTQLLITVFLGWLGIGFFITGVWAFIEIIVVNKDAQGLRM
jgi:TM2 domain-containing membrane protein YozV